jgi:predicted lipoprotein with Yx(FWY)xxD motif
VIVRRPLPALTVALLLVAGCQGEQTTQRGEFETTERDPGADPDIDATDPEGADPEHGDRFDGEDVSDAEFTTASSTLGEHLVDGAGQSVYALVDDDPDGPGCVDACLSSWPVVSTADEPQVDASLDAELLGTVERADGNLQVTYNGRPLHYYTGDDEPGDLRGHGVDDLWSIVTPAGDVIGSDQDA